MTDWYGQTAFRVRLEWGRRGAVRAAKRGDVVVLVDVLSFSTLAAIAVARGAILYPCRTQAEVEETAQRVGGVIAQRRRHVTGPGHYSLSPQTFDAAPRGARIAIASPNGATCCRLAQAAPRVFVGGLLNASATAMALVQTITETNLPVTLVACGERWMDDINTTSGDTDSTTLGDGTLLSDNAVHSLGTLPGDGPLRVALEDMLGAGAIAAYLPTELPASPDIRAAVAAFRALENDLETALLTCGSGVELMERGFANDVRRAARLNGRNTAVVFVAGERLQDARSL